MLWVPKVLTNLEAIARGTHTPVPHPPSKIVVLAAGSCCGPGRLSVDILFRIWLHAYMCVRACVYMCGGGLGSWCTCCAWQQLLLYARVKRASPAGNLQALATMKARGMYRGRTLPRAQRARVPMVLQECRARSAMAAWADGACAPLPALVHPLCPTEGKS